MKNFTICFLFLSQIGLAQITYTSTDFAAQGESYLVSTTNLGLNTFDFTTAGPNISWNYPTLTPATQETISFVNPNNTGYRISWCFLNGYLFNCNSQFNNNFNLAQNVTDGLVLQGIGLTNVFMHSKVSATNFANKMIGGNVTLNGTTLPFTVDYTSPDVLYQFPMNYNDTYTNTSALALDLTALGLPVSLSNTGERTTLVEGWGSLTTPFGTFTNTLKLKSTVVETTSITNNGQTTDIPRTIVSYKWFDTAYGIPVLEVSGDVIANQWVPTSAVYFDIPRCLEPSALFAFFPLTADFDPDTQTASLSFINASSNYDSLSWDFDDNTTSTQVNPTHIFNCPGLKQVTLTVTNEFCEPDQVDTITIPVTITDSQNAFTTGVTVDATSLTADRTLTGTSYQWLDCDNGNQPIQNATNGVFTPTQDGNYAVQLTTNGCTDVSDCVSFQVLSNTSFDSSKVTLVPNPTSGSLYLSDATIQINKVSVYSVLGVQVGSSLDLSQQAKGIYIVKLETDSGNFIKQVVKQ
jgi:PKD repeat protein